MNITVNYWRRSRETAAPRKRSTFRLVSPILVFFWIGNAYCKGVWSRERAPRTFADWSWSTQRAPHICAKGPWMQCIADKFWGHGEFFEVLEVLWGHFGGMLGSKRGSWREDNSDVQKGPSPISIWGPQGPPKVPKDVQEAVIGGQNWFFFVGVYFGFHFKCDLGTKNDSKLCFPKVPGGAAGMKDRHREGEKQHVKNEDTLNWKHCCR